MSAMKESEGYEAGYEEFMSDKTFVMTILGEDTPAAKQGMVGKYYLLEFAGWMLDDKRNLLETNDEMRGKPKDIVVMKDGEILEYHFEDAIGCQFGIEYIGKDKKKEIVRKYYEWRDK